MTTAIPRAPLSALRAYAALFCLILNAVACLVVIEFSHSLVLLGVVFAGFLFPTRAFGWNVFAAIAYVAVMIAAMVLAMARIV